MAFSSGVFTSTSGAVNGDGIFVGNKANTAAQLAKEKKMLYGNGISLDPTSAFYVAPKTGLTATVSAGWGIMDGYWFEESADYDITMTSSVSDQTLYIGVRLDVATGEYTDSHVAARTTFVPATDRVFAIVVIPANAVTLTSGMITDTRNNSTYCGTVNAQREALAALQAEYTEKLEVLESTGIPIHASTHATGESDEIIPTSIGAMPYDAASTNLLINGGFDVWQRGTSQTVTGYGSDDKWGNSLSNSTKTHSRQTFTVGQTDVPGNPIYYSRSVVTTSNAANALNVKFQNIEDVSRFSGERVTVSFWAKADAAKNIAIEFLQQFGMGGSTSVTGIGSQKIALTTSWAKCTATVDIPSIAGKTVGTSSTFQLRFWFEAGSDYNARTDTLGNQSGTFDIANVQLNYGSVALPFVSNGYTELLAQASRYVVIPTVATIYGRMVLYTANTITFFVPTMAPMSRNPSIRGTINTDYIVYNNAGTAQTGFTSGSATAVANGVIVVMTKTSHGLTDGSIGIISPNGGFDADF